MKRLLATVCASAIFAANAVMAAGPDAYPQRPIKLVVPVPPGGAGDFIGRILAQKLGELVGQSIVVENRGGASGMIASQAVARAEADGYTLLLSSSTSHGTTPVVTKHVPYAPLKDFTHIGLVATVPAVVTVNNDLPVKSIKELIDHAKKNPSQLNYGSSGVGSPLHLWGELFKSITGTALVHVPYKGAGPAVVDLMAGRIQVMFDGLPSQISSIQAGKTRALAAMSNARSTVLPQLPTMGELGFPDVVGGLWFGVSGPAGTPQAAVDKLSKALFEIAQMRDVRDAFGERGIVLTPMKPKEYTDFIRSENDKYGEVARKSNISLD